MNTLDYLIIAPLLFAAWRGYRKGALQEVFQLAGVVIGLLLAFRLMAWASGIVSATFGFTGVMLPAIAFVSVFVAVILAFVLLGRVATGALGTVGLGALNNAGGAALGALKMAFVVSGLLVAFTTLRAISPESQRGSAFYGPVRAVAPETIRMGGVLLPGMSGFYHKMDSTLRTRETLHPEVKPVSHRSKEEE